MTIPCIKETEIALTNKDISFMKKDIEEIKELLKIYIANSKEEFASKETCIELKKAFWWVMGGVIAFVFTVLGTAIFQLILR